MRFRAITAAGLVAVLVGGLAQASAAPPPRKEYGMQEATYIIETRHGKLYAEVVHPVDGTEMVKAPTILTYSPYSVLGRNGDAGAWVPKGYARMFVDVVGTGNSGGCYDYGGIREKETGYDVVEWIAKQKWSNGKVAMMGASYEGTTATATAVMKPPHLTTIVPEGAISRWYGYAYSGGIRYTLNNEWMSHQGTSAPDDEGFDTPLLFDFGLAIPPPVDPENPDWAERVQSTVTPCEEIQHTERGYDDTPDYDKFWLERDYLKDAKKIEIPVLVAHNWGDWNVKQEEGVNLYRALTNSANRHLYMGSRWDDHGVPGGDYGKFVMDWMEHYLMGVDNGIEKAPDVTSEMSDSEGRLDWYSGPWPKTTNVTLIAQETPKTEPDDPIWKLMPDKPSNFGKAFAVASFPSANINTESHASHHARENHDWFWFESPPLARDTRLFGSPKVQVWATVQRKWVTITPSIFDMDPGDHEQVGGQHVNTDPKALVAVTRGWLDSRYRKSLAKQVEVTPGESFKATVVAKPQDYTFKAGHHIGLNIQTEINEWSLPKPYPGCDAPPNPTSPPGTQDCTTFRINWEDGQTRLILPIVNARKDAEHLFMTGGHQHGGEQQAASDRNAKPERPTRRFV